MAGAAIGIAEGAACGNGLMVGRGDVSHKMTITIQFGLESAVETVIFMAAITLILGYPIVFVMPGSKGHAFRIFHIVYHGFHHMATGARFNRFAVVEDVEITQETQHNRAYDQRSKCHPFYRRR